MISKKQIDQFLQSPDIAFVGISRNPKKFSNLIFNELQNRGYRLIPIHPVLKNYQGIPCYENIHSIPYPVKACFIITPRKASEAIFFEALNKNIDYLWIQQGSETNEIKKIADSSSQNIIYGKCLLMFLEPVKGWHLLHKNISKILGNLPKD